MVAIELVKDRSSKQPAADERNTLVQRCFENGLLLLGCGQSSVRFCPPLIIDRQHVETAVEILDRLLDELEGTVRSLDRGQRIVQPSAVLEN